MGFDTKKKVNTKDKNIKGKNFESLAKSRAIRAKFLEEFGFFPDSILISNRSDKKLDFISDIRGGRYSGFDKEVAKKVRKKEPGLEYSRMKFDGHGDGKKVLSGFPQNVGRFIVKLYCPENGIVYDPFAGHNSRIELVFRCDREYIGVDCSKEFMEANRKVQETLLGRSNRGFVSDTSKCSITLIEGSSDKVDLPDEYADFTITSPPYWDIEYYGDEPEQLGNAKTYDKFLDLLFEHVKENYRILKPNSFCCWFINDFRKNKVFYPYHIDMYHLLEGAGFIPFAIYIVDLGGSVGAVYLQNIIKYKQLPKRHEYCLVFKKEE